MQSPEKRDGRRERILEAAKVGIAAGFLGTVVIGFVHPELFASQEPISPSLSPTPESQTLTASKEYFTNRSIRANYGREPGFIDLIDKDIVLTIIEGDYRTGEGRKYTSDEDQIQYALVPLFRMSEIPPSFMLLLTEQQYEDYLKNIWGWRKATAGGILYHVPPETTFELRVVEFLSGGKNQVVFSLKNLPRVP